MPNNYQYIELSFINEYTEIKRQIVNTIAITFLLSKGYDATDLNSYLESTQYGYNASAKAEGKNQLLRITDINSGKVNWNNVPHCDCEDEKKYLLNKGDILIARTGGTTGKSFLIDEVQPHSIFASYLIRLRANKKCLPEFMTIFLNSYVFWSQISELKSGSAQPNVNAEKLKTLSIPDCPVDIQKKIVNILKGTCVDDDEFTIELRERIESVELLIKNNEEIKKELDQQQTYIQLLRQTILQEAVQGKLTKQNKADEPASELLKRIKAEKQKLIKEGKLKREKELPPITEGEIPFQLPKGWVWCRLGEVCIKIGSGSTPRGGREVYANTGIKFIRSQNVYNDGLVFDNVAFIDEATHKKMEGTKVIPNDILLNITGGSIGRSALVSREFDEANVNQHVTIIRTVNNLEREYIHKLIISPYFQEYIMATQTGGNREGLAKKNMELMLIPLPPLAEQQRIVAKVQQLQQQLSQLEAQVQQSHQYAQQLLQSVLKEAFAGKSKAYEVNEEMSLAAEK